MTARATAFAAIVAAMAGALAAQPRIGGCPVFPSDHAWNTPVDHLPVDRNSGAYVASIGPATNVHPDFGSGLFNGGPIGIPFIVVPGTTPKAPATFEYASESDPGPYAVPRDAPIEGGPQSNGDRHAIALDRDNCILYELFAAYPQADGSWRAGSGAIFDLRGYGLRPAGWTSADAAGLAILPGLVRHEEVLAGEIGHAIRFTARRTRRAYVWPARHFASSITSSEVPPMGQRFRLRAGYDISGFHPENQVILRAMKKYGIILADNGSDWFLSGAPDERWNNTRLRELRRVVGSDFEAVDTSSLMIAADSGRARQPSTPSVSIAHAATFQPGPFAPGLIFSLFGSGLSTVATAARVLFDSEPAVQLFVSPSQINLVAPFSLAGRSLTRVRVVHGEATLLDEDFPVSPSAPGIFGVLNQDFTLNAETNAAVAGTALLVFGTGAGQTDPPSRDGQTSTGLSRIVADVAVEIGGQRVEVLYAGGAPGLVSGVAQVNVVVPAGLAAGRHVVRWWVGAASAEFAVWVR